MKDITAEMTTKELVQMGQAMERKGFQNVNDYLLWVTQQKTASILAEEK